MPVRNVNDVKHGRVMQMNIRSLFTILSASFLTLMMPLCADKGTNEGINPDQIRNGNLQQKKTEEEKIEELRLLYLKQNNQEEEDRIEDNRIDQNRLDQQRIQNKIDDNRANRRDH
jgi:hypothetical protein